MKKWKLDFNINELNQEKLWKEVEELAQLAFSSEVHRRNRTISELRSDMRISLAPWFFLVKNYNFKFDKEKYWLIKSSKWIKTECHIRKWDIDINRVEAVNQDADFVAAWIVDWDNYIFRWWKYTSKFTIVNKKKYYAIRTTVKRLYDWLIKRYWLKLAKQKLYKTYWVQVNY